MVLRRAGLELMRMNGKNLTKCISRGRSMIYEMTNGQKVRMRTSNDRTLIVNLNEVDELDIEIEDTKTEWLLIVMPEIKRTAVRISAYLVPTKDAGDEIRRTHLAWEASNPNTKGSNTTWTLRFDEYRMIGGYADKWEKYRLKGKVINTEPMA